MLGVIFHRHKVPRYLFRLVFRACKQQVLVSSVKVPVVKAKHHLFIGSSLLRVAAGDDRSFAMQHSLHDVRIASRHWFETLWQQHHHIFILSLTCNRDHAFRMFHMGTTIAKQNARRSHSLRTRSDA